MRNNFDKQLDNLNEELIVMGKLCESAIRVSLKALLEDRETLVPEVYSTDDEIDNKEREIEQLCMKLLLQQQPVAKDLRVISSALKMISDMERIGDQAADIADISKVIKKFDSKSHVHIKDMAAATILMVTTSIDSFVKKDLKVARDVIVKDDIVDSLFVEVRNELVEIMSKNPEKSEECLDLLMIAKYLERIGDHATNIAEWVIYSITGYHESEEDFR